MIVLSLLRKRQVVPSPEFVLDRTCLQILSGRTCLVTCFSVVPSSPMERQVAPALVFVLGRTCLNIHRDRTFLCCVLRSWLPC